MAERENPFTVMKHYLATLNKRIDELASKTTSLNDDAKRLSEQEASERTTLSERFDSDKADMSSKLEELSSKVEEYQSQLMQAVEQLKQHVEGIRSSSLSREDLQALQISLREEIAPLREQKLERSEFQEFVEKNNASMKGVFEELTGSESFADFASSQVASRPEPLVPVVEEAPTSTESVEPIESEPASREGFIPEHRREEKRKKKWL